MPGSPKDQWRELEHGCGEKCKGHHHRKLSTQQRTRLFGSLVVVLLFFLFWRYHSQSPAPIFPVIRTEVRPGAEKYAIVTFETRQVTYWKESLGNKLKYARRHGYDMIPAFERLENDDQGGGVWSKLLLVNETLNTNRFDWVLWLDFDTLFTNLSSKLEDFMDDVQKNHLSPHQQWDQVNMIASPDWSLLPPCARSDVRGSHSFNAGVILFRNSAWTRWFLNTVWALRGQQGVSEQDAMRSVLENLGEFEVGKGKFFVRVPQWKLNGYPEENTCREDRDRPWKRGNWIIHFPGSWVVIKSQDPFGDMLRRYHPYIVE